MGIAGTLIANPAIGRALVRTLVSEYKNIRLAVDRLPPEANTIYTQAVADLHVRMAKLPTAEDAEEKARIEINLQHIKTTLDSLDAITKIQTYRATVSALGKLTRISLQVALTVAL